MCRICEEVCVNFLFGDEHNLTCLKTDFSDVQGYDLLLFQHFLYLIENESEFTDTQEISKVEI